jgi:aspartyl protease family protein
MGHVVQSVKITADKTAIVSMLVDTGATFSLIPKEMARALGIKRLRQSVTIRLADGRPMKVGATTAVFKIGDREALSTILVGDVAEPILGVETLEVLGLAVDPRSGRLRPTRGYAARLGGSPVLRWSVIPHGARRRNQRATSPQTT